MNLFRTFSYLSTGLTYLLIFVGGLVRVSGAGMGCPDWPKCFDRWIPPTNISQLPDHIDPAKFNIVLAWIEYSNRLFGALVGLTITIALFLAIKYFSHRPTIKWPLVIAFILTLIEGWLGSVLVHTILNPITITLHLLLALIIVMLLLYAAQESYYIQHPDSEKNSKYPSNIKWVFLILGFSLLIEIIIGTEIRGGLQILRKENPLLDSNFLLVMLGPFKYMHTILGIVILILSIFLWIKLVKKAEQPSDLVVQSSSLILFLIFLQIVSGEVLVFVKVKPIVQLFHLWFAAIIMGLISVQYCAWKKSQSYYE